MVPMGLESSAVGGQKASCLARPSRPGREVLPWVALRPAREKGPMANRLGEGECWPNTLLTEWTLPGEARPAGEGMGRVADLRVDVQISRFRTRKWGHATGIGRTEAQL